MPDRITIILRQTEDGTIRCDARIDEGFELSSTTGAQAIGILEIAKMSFLTGRWGVLDAKKESMQHFPDLFEEYRRSLQEGSGEGKTSEAPK